MTTIEALRERVAVRRALPPPPRRRELRERSRLALREIAETVGADEASVSRWERGVVDPRGEHLERYVAVLRLLEECEKEAAGDGAP